MDRKTFSLKITSLDGEGRTVEGYANVFGNLDAVGDIVHPGAFVKTLNERGGKIKFLWQHDLSEPLGRMVEMHEDAYGLAFKAVISDTARGRDALALLKDGAVDSFSIGYDSIKGATDYTKDPDTGATVRNLREVKLYEVSLVTLAANELATMTGLKEAPTEGKPWRAVHEGDVWKVYKLDEDGEPTGEPLGEHATEEEAQAQVRALYANTEDGKAVTRSEADGDHPAGHYLVVEDPEKPSTWHLRVCGPDGKPDHRLMGAAWAALHGGYRGAVYEGPGKEEAIDKLTRMYHSEDMQPPAGKSSKAGRVLAARNAQRIMQAMAMLKEALDDAGIMMPMDEEDHEPEGSIDKAGPDGDAAHRTPPPTQLDERTRKLKMIEIEEQALNLWR